jgi:hypothetical protein
MKHETTLFKIALITIILAIILLISTAIFPLNWIKLTSCILFAFSGTCRLIEGKPIGIIPILISLIIFLIYLNVL